MPAGAACNSWTARIETVCRNRPCESRTKRRLYIAHVKDLEVFSGDRVFIAPSQKTHLIGVLEFLDAGWIAAKFLDEMFHRPRVLYSAVNQLFLSIPFHLESEDRSHDYRGDGNECDKQDESDQDVSALGATAGARLSRWQDHGKVPIE